MATAVAKALLVLALPIVVFLAGARLMGVWSGRDRVVQRLAQHAAPEDRKPLNQRLGYGTAAVARHWGALDPVTRAAERHFLELDLAFPLFYGAAFLVSLLLAWATLGRPFHPVWIVGLVGIMIASDWTENLLQLTQLSRYVELGAASLQSQWIAIASVATVVKLASFAFASLGVLYAAYRVATSR